MEERKIMDGVYFTDYRESNKPAKPTCAPKGVLADFVTLDKVEAIDSEQELRYVWGEVFKRWTWLLKSTLELFEFPDEFEFIEENMGVIQRYRQMIDVMETKTKQLGMEALDVKELAEQRQVNEEVQAQYQKVKKVFVGGTQENPDQTEEGIFV